MRSLAVLGFLVAVSPLAVASEAPGRLTVRLVDQGELPALPAGAQLTLRAADGSGAELALPLDRMGRGAIELPPASLWRVGGQISGVWIAPQVAAAPPAGEEGSLRLAVWPLAELEGRLVLPADEIIAPLKALSAEIAAAGSGLLVASRPAVSGDDGDEPPFPLTRVPCSIDGPTVATSSDRTVPFRCPVPATALDLAVQVPGFIPHYRWAIAPTLEEPADVGTLQLQPGASVAGRVAVAAGQLRPRRCQISLKPRLAPGATGPAMQQLLDSAPGATPLPNGFFQLGPVEPGSFELGVEHPGYAPARVVPLNVSPEAETRLTEALILERPVTVGVTVNPPVDWLGRRWRLTLYKASDLGGGFQREEVFAGMVGDDGRVEIAGQAPGSYLVAVDDSAGNSLYSRRGHEVKRGDAEIDIELDLFPFEGTVSLAGEPLPGATVIFGGTFGAVRIPLEADDEGRVSGILPREGRWTVEVRAEEPELVSYLEPAVERGPSGIARVDLALPDTQVFGTVVDPEGQPVEGARVDYTSTVWTADETSDEAGEFRFLAVPPEQGLLDARLSTPDGLLTSEGLLITPQEEEPSGPHELRLLPRLTVIGRVISELGPVPGAVVSLSPIPNLKGSGDTVETGAGGLFTATLPGDIVAFRAVVSAPGHALKAFQIPIPGAGERREGLRLAVLRVGGTLHLRFPDSVTSAQGPRPIYVVWQDGLPIPMNTLGRWAIGHGARITDTEMTIPHLAPGSYQVCLGRIEVISEQEISGWKERSRCVSAYLAPGAEVEIDLREGG